MLRLSQELCTLLLVPKTQGEANSDIPMQLTLFTERQ